MVKNFGLAGVASDAAPKGNGGAKVPPTKIVVDMPNLKLQRREYNLYPSEKVDYLLQLLGHESASPETKTIVQYMLLTMLGPEVRIVVGQALSDIEKG